MTSTGSVAVKQERHDEAEINEMAAKIMEAHKQQSAKAAAAAVQQVPGARPAAVGATVAANGVVVPGQANILNYLTRKPTATTVGPANTIMSTVAAAPSTALTALPLGSGQGVASNGGSGKAYDGGGDSNGSVNGSGEKKANDEESQKGRFGWETFPGKVYIPCILRQQERYCAVRMVEMKLLNKYLTVLHQDIYTCTCVRSYYITEAECKLLNEINTKHCDLHYGREMFTLKDLVVRVSDAYKFHQFLDVCYKKLTVGCGPTSDKCGFIRINKESVVPYTVRDGQKMVPLFYFEGETDNLKLKADNLSGWDLSYLKFCCKVQGIRNELFASDSVAVISLTDIKGYFPPGTEFEDYWPSKVVDSQLLCGPKTNNTVHWTRQPVQPPPKAPTILNNTAAVPRKVATNNVYQALQTQQNLAKTNNQMNSITAAVQALTNNWNIVNSNHTNLLSAQQEQLLRLSQAQQLQFLSTLQAAQAQAQIRNMQSMHSMQQYNTYLNNMSLTSRASQNQPVPPPLVRSAQAQAAHLSNMAGATLNQQQQMAAHQQAAVQQQQQQSQSNKRSASNLSGGGRSNTIISSSSGSNGSGGSSLGVGSNYRNPGAAVLQQLQQQQQQQQQAQHHAAAAAAAVAAAAAAANMADATPRLGNVILIPELNASVTPYNKPYEVVKKPVENKFIYCVNKTPYTRPAELLMSIFDLKDVFFPYSSVDVCRRVLAALDVNLFIGNSLQIQALQEAGRTNIDQKMPLVHLTDVMTFMPQLQYMVRSQIQDTPANKRARIS
ncbi:uncharacterized protein LOC131289770 isoform X2 [Anopheles ziemanni]|uniref:uncharacterized protein LOC131261265 isoform X2 n=1 Tax=Anopheles coustani TaxID=139045 RepID=UPI0026598F9B|nr:uncharacterized protein LOC131261265 isoform X2 [Anopheles coustani]XP_058175064.1 uncharacterized protein LOC131289770 isoform X2 [Anopheles ziemanni]